jgi:glutamate racemase
MSAEKSKLRVCVFDSGIGGLPFLTAILEEFPYLELHYVADDAGFPYGTKSAEAIRDILFERIRRVRARLDPDILVISCMTAVQVGLRDLQEAHRTMHIVGAIPPIAAAARETRTRRIALMTTALAAEDRYLDNLIARDAPDIEVIRIPAQDLVDYVEQRLPFAALDSVQASVEPYIKYVHEEDIDRIVLASSHFVLLEQAIHNVLSIEHIDHVRLLDSRKRVLSELRSLIRTEGWENPDPQERPAPESAGFFLTGDRQPAPSYLTWASRFKLSVPQLL